MLEFRHYAGLPCHLAGRTQAVAWPAQDPSLYTGAKGPFKRQAQPTLALFFSAIFSEEAAFCLFSLPPNLSVSPSHFFSSLPHSLYLNKLRTQARSAMACLSPACVPAWQVPLITLGM